MAEAGRKRRAGFGTGATDPASLPVEFADLDIRTATYPRKCCRVRQP